MPINRRQFLAGGAAVMGAGLVTASSKPAAAATQSEALGLLSATDAARAIQQGMTSSRELTQLMFDRIASQGRQINAVVTLARESAVARAKAADEATAKKQSWGPLHGVPCTVKDTFETAGIRTTAGAPFLKDYVPKSDAAVVERLKKAGAILIGKTNTPLMAGDFQTFNDVLGTTMTWGEPPAARRAEARRHLRRA